MQFWSCTTCFTEDGFQDLQDEFLSAHCEEFDEEEENKLVYTEIYNNYITQIEGYISRRLKELHPSFQMNLLLSLIQWVTLSFFLKTNDVVCISGYFNLTAAVTFLV